MNESTSTYSGVKTLSLSFGYTAERQLLSHPSHVMNDKRRQLATCKTSSFHSSQQDLRNLCRVRRGGRSMSTPPPIRSVSSRVEKKGTANALNDELLEIRPFSSSSSRGTESKTMHLLPDAMQPTSNDISPDRRQQKSLERIILDPSSSQIVQIPSQRLSNVFPPIHTASRRGLLHQMARKVKQSEFKESNSFPDTTSTRESLPEILSFSQCSSKDEAPITQSTNVSESSALSRNENPLDLNEQTSRRILLVGDRILPRQLATNPSHTHFHPSRASCESSCVESANNFNPSNGCYNAIETLRSLENTFHISILPDGSHYAFQTTCVDPFSSSGYCVPNSRAIHLHSSPTRSPVSSAASSSEAAARDVSKQYGVFIANCRHSTSEQSVFLSPSGEKLVLDHHYHDFDPGVIRIPLSHSCPNSSECPDRSDLIPRSLSSTKYSERRRRNGDNISKFSFPPKMKEMILHDFIASSRDMSSQDAQLDLQSEMSAWKKYLDTLENEEDQRSVDSESATLEMSILDSDIYTEHIMQKRLFREEFLVRCEHTHSWRLPVRILLEHSDASTFQRSAEELGFECVSHPYRGQHYNLYIPHPDEEDGSIFHPSAFTFDRIGRFPGLFSLFESDKARKILTRAKNDHPEALSFWPQSWVLPDDLEEFQLYMHEKINFSEEIHDLDTRSSDEGSESRIYRRVLSANGSPFPSYLYRPPRQRDFEHSFVFHDYSALNGIDSGVVQECIQKPLLIDGCKFDLRFFVVLTSIDPLRAYVHKEGIVRFTSRPYQAPVRGQGPCGFRNIPNWSLNYVDDILDQIGSLSACDGVGSRRTISSIFGVLEDCGYDSAHLLSQINDLIHNTLIVLQPFIAAEYFAVFSDKIEEKSRCYQILAFDVVLNSLVCPFLVEIVSSPSFSSSSPIAKHVKDWLVSEMLIMCTGRDLPQTESNVEKSVLWNSEDYLVGFSRLHPSLADELTSFHLSSSILCSAVSAYLHACGVRSQGRMKRSRFVAICNRVIHIDEKERRNLESNPPRLISAALYPIPTLADMDLLFDEIIRRGSKTTMDFVDFLDALRLLAQRRVKAHMSSVQIFELLVESVAKTYQSTSSVRQSEYSL